MSPRMITELERIRYRKGQILASRDLRDDQDFEALLRRIHNRYLHDTWGIAAGLEVQNRTTETIQVLPGVAYDGYGREVLLAKAVVIKLPSLNMNEASDLAIRYKESSEFPSRSEIGSVCWAEEAEDWGNLVFPSMLEQPVFVWRAPGTTRLGAEIPLARVKRIPTMSTSEVGIDLQIRYNAYGLSRPPIGFGLLKFDLVNMIPWVESEDAKNSSVLVGFEIEVDTAEVGFTSTPCYMLTSRSHIPFDQQDLRLPVPFFEFIANPQPDGFIYRFMLLESIIPLELRRGLDFKKAKFEIRWLGIEHTETDQVYTTQDGGMG